MSFRSILLCFIIFLPVRGFSTPAGNILKGTIKDSTGAGVPGAVISIPDLKTGATSDVEGNYAINNLPQGTYLVQIHMLSYNTIATAVNINGVTVKNFVLTNSVIEGSEVVITGASLATEQRKSPTPITSVRMKELQESSSTNIIDAVAKLPGVNEVTTGPAVSKPIIRGLGGNRILVVSDNVRQEGQQWGDEHGVEIDDYNVSKVEVLKGPASLAYGSDALAGVINIITDEPPHDNTTEGSASINYQTNSGLAAGNLNIGSNKNGLAWKAFGTYKTSHDYRNQYDGYVYNSRFNNLNYGASIGLNKQWGFSRLSFTSFNQRLGIPEGDRDSATGHFLRIVNENGTEEEQIVPDNDGNQYAMNQLPYQKINHQKAVWNNSLFLKNGSRLGLTLGYQVNSRKEFTDVLRPEEPGLYLLLKTFSYDLKYFFPLIDNWQLTAGINGMSQTNENKGSEFLVPDYNLFDIGAYAIARKDIGKWSFSAGLRYDYRKLNAQPLYIDSAGDQTHSLQPEGQIRFNDFSRSFSNVTGSIGSSYAVNKKLVLKLNVASGYRAPNIAELSANGVHEGTIRYEYGNNDLKAENSFQADLGAEYNAEHLYINVALFGNYISNFIYIRKLQSADGTDSIPSVNNEDNVPAYQYDQGNALLYGGELFVDLHPHPFDWLHLENSFSYVRGTQTGNVTDSTRNLPDIPSARWLVQLRAQKHSLKHWLKNGYVKLGADINFDQPYVFSAYQTETTSTAYTLFNAGLGADIVNHRQKTVCTISLSLENIFNTAYQNHLSRLRYAPYNYANDKQGIWSTGRNFSILLSFPLGFR
jgi:iron complex outermembrane receptor protein